MAILSPGIKNMNKVGLSFLQFILIAYLGVAQNMQDPDFDVIYQKFQDPPTDYWPHTRWWWPGNPVSKEGITWQLEQMREHGIRGVEQITMAPFYKAGNIPYLSAEFIEMLKNINFMLKTPKFLKD